MLGALVCAGVLSLKQVATAILKAASKELGHDGKLAGSGSAWKLISAVLQAVAQNSNQHQMSQQWKQTGLQLDAFLPSVSESIAHFFTHLFVASHSLTSHSLIHACLILYSSFFFHQFLSRELYLCFCFIASVSQSISQSYVQFFPLVNHSLMYARANHVRLHACAHQLRGRSCKAILQCTYSGCASQRALSTLQHTLLR